ncbi:MAG: RAMP superfamily CRISPR-associated protein [Sulfuricaulis sp.]
MNIFDSYRMLITPLSPVHIGTGESYEPTNYVIEDGVLHEFDTGTVVGALTASDRKELLDIANRKPDWKMILNLRKFFFDRRKSLIPWAIQRVPVTHYVDNLYEERIARAAQHESGGGKVLNELAIDRTSFNPITRQPVLFGSSLKGAMRTALLNNANEGRRAYEKKGLHEFQGRLFKYRDPENGKQSLELDPMRLVQLADAGWQGEQGLPAAQVHLAVNRKKAPVADEQGKLRKSSVESGNGPDQILECISGWRYRAFSGQINLQSVEGVADQNKKGQRRLPAEDLRFDMAQIVLACNDFYKPILESENQLMRERGYLDDAWGKSIEQLLKTNDARMRRGDVFLLRVGRHSGAESVTLNGVRSIKIMEGKGPDGKNKSSNANAAKTLWLAADTKDQSTKLLPFGWVLVELQPMDAPPQDWPELKDACEPHLANARAFAAKLAAKQTEIEQARIAAETRRRDEAEKIRRRAEEEQRQQRAEKERQERLVAMSQNQRRIEEFKTAFAERAKQLRGKPDRQNTDYHDRARKLAKDALEGADWTAEEKRAVADAIGEWLPKVVERIDKDQLKKLKLAALRGDA